MGRDAFGRYLAWRTRRAGPPVALGVKAARYGAAAFALALLLLAVPTMRGHADAQRRLALDPDLCGAALPVAAGDGRSDLRRAAEAYFIEACEAPA